ncbi:hypothetical protein KR059_003813, partial [Drosophila kikkawai]
TAPAAPAAAGKKKCKNKKKAEKPGPGPGKEEKQEDQLASNGCESVKELQGLLEQLQLCTGLGYGPDKTPGYTPEETTGFYLEATAHNGHAHGHSNGNNNHIRSSNNNISSGSVNHKNNVDSSNNNNSSSSSHKRIKDDSQEKEKEQQEEVEKDAKEESITATIKSTANTTTRNATTLTTGEGGGVAATGSISGQEELPSTSAKAVTATAAPAAATSVSPAEPQELLPPPPNISADEIVYKEYEAEHQMHDIMRLIQAELSEPYSIYTYRYFIYNWPKLCFLASHDNQYVGAIVCKLDMHMNVRRGYIAMLAVRKEYRKLKIGTTLVTKAIEAMLADNADEVVLETEMRNEPALRLYENLGFVRDKRLFRYYLNGVDALRLKLWFR